jgi:hypothetical protein
MDNLLSTAVDWRAENGDGVEKAESHLLHSRVDKKMTVPLLTHFSIPIFQKRPYFPRLQPW